MNRDSDLIAIPFILGIFAAVIVVAAGFFLVGPVVGLVLLLVSLVLVGYVAYRGLQGGPDGGSKN
jgi:hypothetical protein